MRRTDVRKKGGVKVVVYPVGYIGMLAINIMQTIYNIEPVLLLDNHKCKFNEKIKPTIILNNVDTSEYVLFLTSTNVDIYAELKLNVNSFFCEDRIIELERMVPYSSNTFENYTTKIGKYSYGSICVKNHRWIESIGAFCSFADGVDFVTNHEFRYVTTHPIIFDGKHIEGYEYPFEHHNVFDYYMHGIEPKTEKVKKQKRAKIGNDVWLGRNVIVTNSANIGNGVIAGAGAVITKDVPDYAIVAGVPAKIIRYRYSPNEIEALNEIAWWNWSDDEIRERFDDFYLPIDEFIEKYYKTK